MEEVRAIGVDVGGTKIAFALIDEAGHTLASHRVPTVPGAGIDAALESIADGIRRLASASDMPVSGVGIGAPGQVSATHGRVQNAVNLGWQEVALAQEIGNRVGLPVYVEKDVNALAIGEMYFGAAHAHSSRDFVLVAVGTGLGGSSITNGEILPDANDFAMEIGHMAVTGHNRRCKCGLEGCAETVVSGVGLMAGLREYLPRYPFSPLAQESAPTTSHILAAARAGDPLANLIMDEASECLNRVLAICATVLNPGMFIIGGGLGRAASDFFLEPARESLKKRTLPMSHQGVIICEVQVTDSAVGAACLVRYALSKT